MAKYDGSIKFDTSIDRSNFESGMEKLKSCALKGMAVIGTSFTAAAGYAVNLASDLQEVQNVVDVTFGDRAADIEAWAKNAAGAFGLSELQAKQFNGTMGAMIKSMGLSESAVLDMSTTLTGLAADFASFYNLEHQEAFDKIRAGISGETEPLKQLGINMSVANLEAYALSQGITKSYNAMSQAEQVTLRYNYLLKAGADAQGDFSRTSDSFANQLKIAQLNVSELAAEFGQTLLPIASKGLGELSSATVELRTAISDPQLKGAIEDAGELIITLMDSGIDLATAVLPKLIQALGFVGNNMRTVAVAAAVLVAAYKAYAIVQAVTGWIHANTVALAMNEAGILGVATANGIDTAAVTLKNLAVGVLTGQITLATAAHKAWSLVMAASPIGFVIAGVAALTAGIAALILTQEKETEAEKKQRKSINENAQAIKDATKSYEDFRQQQADTADQSMAEIGYIENLSKELLKLADDNGKVTDAEKGRAKFILDELNDALGTEYTMTGNIINQYKTLKDSIYELIEAKKYKILMDEASANYEQAIKNEADATAKASKAYEALLAARAAYEEKDSSANKDALDKAQKAYNEAQAYVQELMQSTEVYEEASRLAAEQGTAVAVKYLQEQKQAYADAQNAPKEYADEAEKALIMASDTYRQALINLKQALDVYNESGSESAKARVMSCIEALEGAKEEFTSAGGEAGTAFLNGFDGTRQEMTGLVDSIKNSLSKAFGKGLVLENFSIGLADSADLAIEASKDAEALINAFNDTFDKKIPVIQQSGVELAVTGTNAVANEWTATKLNPIGVNYALGLADGINKGKDSVATAAAGLANLAITTPKNLLVIRSPSRVMRDEIGKMIPLGMAAGITENSDKVVESFDKMLDILDYHRKFDIISEDEYYTELEKLRDKYFAAGTKEWLDYTEEIYTYQKEQLEKQKELYKDTYDEIFDYTSDKIDAVIEKQEAYSKKLKSYGSLFQKVNIKLDEGDISYYRLADLKMDTEAIKQYNELMTSARAKVLESGISESVADSFLAELHNFDIDEGTGMLNALMTARADELSEYLKAYEQKQSFAESSAASMYSSEMETALDESMKLMEQKLTEAGFEIPATFFEAGADAADKFGEAFASEIDVELGKIKEKIEGFKAKIKVDVEVNSDKSSGSTTVHKYYGNNSYYLGGSAETTAKRLEAIRNDEEFRRMSGEGD